MRRRLASLALATAACTLLTGCQIGFEDGEDVVQPVWDLRTSHRIDDVGWPEGLNSDSYFVDPEPGALAILLPEGVTIEGPFDAVANRPPGDTSGDVLENLVVNFDREPVARAGERARDLAQRWGMDGARLADWAARNATRRDNTGSQELAPYRILGAGGPTIEIKARALTDGSAYLSVAVVWEREAAKVD